MRTILITFVLTFFVTASFGVPAKKSWQTYRQKDGTTIQLQLTGDEYMHYFVTRDGLPVVTDDNGNYCYAHAGIGELTPTGILAHEADIRTAAEREQLAAFDMQPASIRRIREASMLRLPRKVGERNGDYIGSKKGLVILVSFKDLDFVNEDSRQIFDEMANKVGYREYGSVGSVHDYFYDQSYGQFDLTFDVVGPYKAPKEMGYYGENYRGSDRGDRVRELIKFAMRSADNDVNYKDYDWDDDSMVDQVYVIYAGYSESSAAPSNTIWPHESMLGTAIRLDNVYLNTYACSSELQGNEGENIAGIGTMCHEFSHCLGLPDFYDTSNNTPDGKTQYGMNMWDLMSAGCYNGDERIPAAFTGYERVFCGWTDYRELTAPCRVTGLKPIAADGEVYKITNPGNRNEYYLLENRNGNTGWDRGFYPNNVGVRPAGLLITHVTYIANRWYSNTVNATGQAYQCMTVFHADNSDETTVNYDGVDYLDANEICNDLYPYRIGVKNTNSLSDTSIPVDTLYTRNTDGSYLMHTSVTNIQKRGIYVDFRFMGGTAEWEEVVAGITETAADDQKEDEIYTVSGVAVGKDPAQLPKGLYIMKGKKYLRR